MTGVDGIDGVDDLRGELAGRIAVVTGAGQTAGSTIGNGRATSLLLARRGAHVVCVDRIVASAEETVAMIAAAGGSAEAAAADVTIEAEVAALVADVLERHGQLDIVVNNVGIGTGDTSATKLAEDDWDRIHDVNLKGTWLMCKHALPPMRARGSGSIVNISSAASVCSTPYLAYKTSKAGVNALTQQLAIASAKRHVRVNAVLPGLLDTPMAIETTVAGTGIDADDLRSLRDAMVPLGAKQGTAWDVAEAVGFLVSDRARFITGICLPVDGGQQARVG